MIYYETTMTKIKPGEYTLYYDDNHLRSTLKIVAVKKDKGMTFTDGTYTYNYKNDKGWYQDSGTVVPGQQNAMTNEWWYRTIKFIDNELFESFTIISSSEDPDNEMSRILMS